MVQLPVYIITHLFWSLEISQRLSAFLAAFMVIWINQIAILTKLCRIRIQKDYHQCILQVPVVPVDYPAAKLNHPISAEGIFDNP
ncbi:hypothetical protein [Methanobrevibacter sp.]|uniref:hypothetical protein n=1 Tax=Methanobrevibacter sp. TaxID=66852 RepID=UPI00386F83D7